MWRLALALCLIGSRAFAQGPGCDPTIIADWTIPYSQGSIQAVSYFVVLSALSVLSRNGNVNFHVGVPLSAARRFTSLANPDSYYTGSISARYSQALLAEQTQCPLLADGTGAFLLSE